MKALGNKIKNALFFYGEFILIICFQEVRESAELSPKGLNEAAGIESLLREIELFSAVPDIVWALWCIHRAVYSGMLTVSF